MVKYGFTNMILKPKGNHHSGQEHYRKTKDYTSELIEYVGNNDCLFLLVCNGLYNEFVAKCQIINAQF